jgi:hypothetical protein
VELLDDGADDGVRLDELHLGEEELVGVGGQRAGGVLADHAGGHLAIDADGDGGLVDGGDALGEDVDADDGGEHQAGDPPQVAAEHPEIVAEGYGGALALRFGRFGIGPIKFDWQGQRGGLLRRGGKQILDFGHGTPAQRPQVFRFWVALAE